MIAGIAAGMGQGSTIIKNAVRSAVNSAISAAKRAAGIQSPSKLFEEEIGAMMSAGMAKGISGNTDLVTNSINKQMQAAVLEVNPVLFRDVGRVSNVANSNVDSRIIYFQPKIELHAQRVTDAEAKRLSSIISREFAKATGGRMA